MLGMVSVQYLGLRQHGEASVLLHGKPGRVKWFEYVVWREHTDSYDEVSME